jgi:hypothetical protein
MLTTILLMLATALITALVTFWQCRGFWRSRGAISAVNVLENMGALDERSARLMRAAVRLPRRRRKPAAQVQAIAREIDTIAEAEDLKTRKAA